MQAALEKEKTSEEAETGDTKEEEPPAQGVGHASTSVQSLTSQMNELGVSSNSALVTPSSDSTEDSNLGAPVQDIDKKIRALKKKVQIMNNVALPGNNMSFMYLACEKICSLTFWMPELCLTISNKSYVSMFD